MTAPAIVASDAQLVNVALGRIGDSNFIVALTDNSAEAQAANQVYTMVRAQVLAAVDWPFARRRIFPAVVAASDWSAGTTYAIQQMARYPAVVGLIYASLQAGNIGNEPDLFAQYWQLVSRDDWAYVYQYPADMIAPRQLVTGARATLPENEFSFVEENDPVLGRILVTDTVGAELAYTALITDPTIFPGGFVDAFAWRLAAELVGPLRRQPELVLKANQASDMAIGRAIAEAWNAQHQDLPPSPRYIAGR